MTENNTLSNLWHSLEELHAVPTADTCKLLSGLLGKELKRLENAWDGLSVDGRLELVRSLQPLADVDFELDFSAIYRMAMTDDDAGVRAAAIGGLNEDEDVRLVPRFAQALRDDTASIVRAAAARALAHFILLGELNKLRQRSFDNARAALIEAYNNPDEHVIVRSRAIEALGYTSADGIPEMIAAAYASTDATMRTSAVLAMGRSADKRWADVAQKELHSSYPDMRYEATRACGELGLTAAVPALVELTEDVDARIQETALWALGQIGGNTAQRTLQRYLHNESATLRKVAREALEELEFFHGDISTFFGPPGEFDGESDVGWDEDDALDFDEDDFDDEDDDEDALEDLIFEGLLDEDDEDDDEEWD